MSAEYTQPEGLHPAAPIYSHVVKAGNTVYIAGQTAVDASGQNVGRGDFTAQAHQVYQNLGKALASVGATYDNLVKLVIFMTDARYREALGKVRTQYIKGNLPVSTLVVVAGLADPDWLLEIDGIAFLG